MFRLQKSGYEPGNSELLSTQHFTPQQLEARDVQCAPGKNQTTSLGAWITTWEPNVGHQDVKLWPGI